LMTILRIRGRIASNNSRILRRTVFTRKIIPSMVIVISIEENPLLIQFLKSTEDKTKVKLFFYLSSFILNKLKKSLNLLKFLVLQKHLLVILNDNGFHCSLISKNVEHALHLIRTYSDITCWLFFSFGTNSDFYDASGIGIPEVNEHRHFPIPMHQRKSFTSFKSAFTKSFSLTFLTIFPLRNKSP
jgi:hypothetical protein